MKTIQSTFRPIILAMLTIGIAWYCLGVIDTSTKAEAKNNKNSLTAGQIIEKIKQSVTCPWQQQTVDTFKAGNPDTPVTGIAVTFMATYDVLGRAVQQGCNFIITHEPTFYEHQEDTSRLDPDPVIEAKRKFIKDNNVQKIISVSDAPTTDDSGATIGLIRVVAYE